MTGLQLNRQQRLSERFLQESNAGYFDIVLIHCQVDEQWPVLTEKFRDELSAFKEKGLIKALGGFLPQFGCPQNGC